MYYFENNLLLNHGEGMEKPKKNFLNSCVCLFLSCSLIFIAGFTNVANAATYSDRFFKAVENNDIEDLQNQIKSGIALINAHKKDFAGKTALIIASDNNFKKIVEVLVVSKDIDVNLKCNPGCCSPLVNAAEHGYTDIIKLLLANKADVNAPVKNGDTALIRAVINGQLEAVKLLVENKADVNKSHGNNTALAIATEKNYKEIVELLKKAGAK